MNWEVNCLNWSYITGLSEPILDKPRLSINLSAGEIDFEFSTKDGDDGIGPVMVVDATTQSGSDTFEIAEINGELIVNGNVEGDGSAKAVAAYLLNL